MSKIIPEIFNGSKRLVLSETLLLHVGEGISISIPLMPGGLAKLNLQIKYLSDGGETHGNMDVVGSDSIVLTLFNVNKGLHSGTAKPFGFKIGDSNFKIYISTFTVVDDVVQATITIYQD